MQELNNVNIRLGVIILSELKHPNYKHYYALAEFINNTIASYLKNETILKTVWRRFSVQSNN